MSGNNNIANDGLTKKKIIVKFQKKKTDNYPDLFSNVEIPIQTPEQKYQLKRICAMVLAKEYIGNDDGWVIECRRIYGDDIWLDLEREWKEKELNKQKLSPAEKEKRLADHVNQLKEQYK